MPRLMLAIAVGRLAGFLSRVAGRGASAVPGLVAERLDPNLIEKLVATVPGGAVVVTGTNGKTTTTKMLVTALQAAGHRILTNPTGSNLARGIATVLIRASRRGRVQGHDLAVFEVDEAAVLGLGPRLKPRLVVVTNLARDQLDRYGELDITARKVSAAVSAAREAVLNADDPVVAALDAGRTAWFGAADPIRSAMPHDRMLYGNGEDPGSPAASADCLVEEASPRGDGQVLRMRCDGRSIEGTVQVPGIYNGYNAAAATLAAARLGVPASDALAAIGGMSPAFGRGQVIDYRGRRVRVLLVKNPAGFNQAVRLLNSVPSAPVLIAINDKAADGRDVSWLWDVGFEDLADSGHTFGTTGLRAADMALRLKYAGIEAWSEEHLKQALDRTVEAAAPGSDVHVVPTYTAMLDLLGLLLPGTSRAEVWS